MTVRTNKQAIYAKTEGTVGTFASPTKENLIPISEDVSKTFLEDNSVEKPELRGTFGANDSVIISQTQAVTIPSFIQGGGLAGANKKNPKVPPAAPLLKACFHEEKFFKINAGKDGIESETSNGDDTRFVRYIPVDGDGEPASIQYQLDGVQQKMTSAKGTMSLSMEVGAFASMTFEMQSAYEDPSVATTSGTAPTFKETLAVSGQNTLYVPGLFDPDGDGGNKALFNKVCVRSFSLTQGVTISSIDCATREGGNPIKYVQTAREATGELVLDVEAANTQLQNLVKAWGGKTSQSAPLKNTDKKITGALVVLTQTWNATTTQPDFSTGNTFVVAANNFKIGAPTVGDSDGIATWTFPLTFIPTGGKPDYELYYVGNLS